MEDFEELYNTGHIRSIGVRNFHPHHIEELMEITFVIHMVNQIRLFHGDTQDEVVDYFRFNNILSKEYCPLGAA